MFATDNEGHVGYSCRFVYNVSHAVSNFVKYVVFEWMKTALYEVMQPAILFLYVW